MRGGSFRFCGLIVIGKLVFQRERWYNKILHNETAYAIQRRLHFAGLQTVILPIRVLEST